MLLRYTGWGWVDGWVDGWGEIMMMMIVEVVIINWSAAQYWKQEGAEVKTEVKTEVKEGRKVRNKKTIESSSVIIVQTPEVRRGNRERKETNGNSTIQSINESMILIGASVQRSFNPSSNNNNDSNNIP